MSLGSKILLTLCTIFLVYMAGEALLQRFVVGPSFTALEEAGAYKDLDRVISALDREMRQLDTSCRDYAYWDDTYAYVIGEKPDYEESNFQFPTFEGNHLNCITIVNNEGQVVYSRVLDLTTGQDLNLDQFPSQGRFPVPSLFPDPPGPETENGQVAGKPRVVILDTNAGMMLVAARNILSTDISGPRRGVFLMGRFLDESVTDQIVEITQVDAHFLPAPPQPLEPGELRRLGYLKAGPPMLSAGIGEDTLQASAVILDLNNEPAVTITAFIPRLMTSEGKNAMRLQFFMAVLGGFGVLIVMALLMNSIVIRPLGHLTRHVQLAGQGAGDAPFTSSKRGDEIGILSNEYSRMIRRVSERSQELRQRIEELWRTKMELTDSETHLKTILESVQAGIVVIDKESREVVDANAHALNFLGVTREECLGKPCLEPLLNGSAVSFGPFGVVTPSEPAEALITLPDGDHYVLRALAPLTLGNRELYLVSFVDITLRKRAEDQVRELTHQVMQVQEEERQAISRDLHDNLGQDLNSVAMGLETLLDEEPAPTPATQAKLTRLADTLNRTISEVRDLSYYLRPPEIDRMGLALTLSELCRETSDKHPLEVSFHAQGGEEPGLTPVEEINLFRIVQEALQNVLRHAQARHVEVRLTMDQEAVAVRVEDDGRGFDPAVDQAAGSAKGGRHMGIRSMRERTELLQGRFSISSLPGQGTVVTAFIPRKHKENSHG